MSVHRHHPDVHTPASDWSEGERLHVAACYSNPFRWETRRRLANDFRRHMGESSNVVLHLIELAYGDRPFEVTDPSLYPNDIQVRSSHEMFHKENLLNCAVSRFPSGWKYGAIIDADFHFTRHDWALETVHQLQHYAWVQVFGSYMNLTGETQPGAGHLPIGQPSSSFAFNFVKSGNTLPAGYNAGWSEPLSSPPQQAALPWVGAPGGAWGFTRESFSAVGGLLDRCILGSADWFMAFGLAGQPLDIPTEKLLGKKLDRYHANYLHYIRSWQERARNAFHGNIGYVDSFALHHFHGPMAKRGYGSRDDILIDNAFDPVQDVHPDWQGVLQLTSGKPKLRDDIRRYFLSRNEDAPQPG